jgi:micrococcal nuclease
MARSNSKSFIIVFSILIALILILIMIIYYTPPNYFQTTNNEFLVTEVVDGDTFVIGTGEYVRLIGVDAPEKEHVFYNKSKDFLAFLILNRTIMLETDKDNKDKYGRLLRYAYLGNLSVNIELVNQGYAIPLFISPNFKHKQEIEQAREECLDKKMNLCASA